MGNTLIVECELWNADLLFARIHIPQSEIRN